ncbi:RagB/SusD family nutrient uptake outer membrane protein [Segatella salivae]|jgi:putative lipoprotein|uniref:RagB/SusD family nutrient uptake outer membrane protein n=1 Tax=Segatella salivae TaxID=228604 RepID=UPI001CAF1662|nr:RagB/SusD family nutrient uptake outer membrane protein [Segatella salivae]MBF1556613.1 RagB/SusD family nutrient uptake outer membrane protein [Segatella salivae]
MKKIYILSISLGLFFCSCDSWLEEKPESMLTRNDFNKTEQHFSGQVNLLYRSGFVNQYTNAGSAYIGPFASISSMLTGYFRNSYEGQEQVCKFARELTRQAETNTVSGTMDGVWDVCYNAINIANSVINNINANGVKISDSAKKQLEAEAKFFRGMNYFFLVKVFGDVPLSTEAYYSASQNMQLERTSKTKVLALVEQDLTDAVNNLTVGTWQNNSHRITKYVAEMALTDMYMFIGNYEKAASCAKDIIQSGLYQLTKNDDRALKSAYNKLRTLDDLPEVIYAEEFDNAVSTSGWRPTYAFTSSATGVFDKYSIFERVFGPTGRFLNIYTDDDLRGQEKQFFATSYTNPNNGKSWNMPVFGNVTSSDPAYYDQIGCWYFFDEEADLYTSRGTKDWNIYRYAETLLDAAEALTHIQGVTAEAADYLAQVQSRALGQSVSTLKANLMNLSKEKFIELCWTERLREFPLEMKIWDDCVRTGKFPIISNILRSGEVVYVDLVGANNGADAKIKQTDLLWPISLNEMQRNLKLTQNEGYQKSNKAE